MKNNNSSSTGLRFVSALTIAFIVLKLCKIINWSWLWVLSPLWIDIIIELVIVIIFCLYYRKISK